MTDDAKPRHELTPQPRTTVGKSVKGGVSGRLKTALDDMVWNATPWEEAARKSGMTTRSMRMAMGKPHVLRYLRRERGVLLASISPENLHALTKLRDQEENKAAAVQAARALEGLANEQFGPGVRGYSTGIDDPQPGVVIQIINAPARPTVPGVTIDITPNDESTG